jgi:hypothetical protein
MTTRSDSVAAPPIQSESEQSVPASAYELQITVLRCRIAALERELEAERERRQAIVTRYERLLDEQ